MHEYHIVEGIVKQALEAARANGALKVTSITLRVGELSGLEEDSIRLYFEDLSRGTILESAEIVVNTVRAKLKCKGCATIFVRENKEFKCPKCGSEDLTRESGKELYIEDIKAFTQPSSPRK